MKKFLVAALLSLSFFAAHAEDSDPHRWAANSWVWSPVLTSASDVAFQVHNPVTTTRNKTIYITQITPSSTAAGTFTVYSTSTGAGFTGTKTLSSAVDVTIPSSATVSAGTIDTSISSVTTCSASSAYTGTIIWQGVLPSSSTFNVIQNYNYPIAIPPGAAIYAVKTNATGNEKTSVTFYWTENYR